MPLAAATEQIVQALYGAKGNDVDFAALIELAADASRLTLEPEDVAVDDGLSPLPLAANGGEPARAAAPSAVAARPASRRALQQQPDRVLEQLAHASEEARAVDPIQDPVVAGEA